MKKQTISLILLLTCQVFAANKPTFINIQTTDGIIHYPIIVSVTETDVILDGQTAIPISSINSVTVYGEVSPILPIVGAGAGGYVGMCGGIAVGCLIFPGFSGNENDEAGLRISMLIGAGIGAFSGFKRASNFLRYKNKKLVSMSEWAIEQKGDFLFSALKP